MTIEVKNRFSPSQKCVSPEGVEPAQQQFKEDCDINTIMARYQKGGAINHVAIHQPQYGVSTPVDYHAALNVVANAQSMFADLPSSLRRKFEGDPGRFLEYVQDEKNADEAKELGIALSDEAQAKADVIKAAEEAAAAAAGPPPE